MEETLGKRIVANRKRLGLTQDQLAEQLGVTAQAVSKWENDLSCPDINMLPKLSDIFGITTDELLGCKKAPPAEAVPENPGDDPEGTAGHAPQNEFKHSRWDCRKSTSIGIATWILLVGIQLLAVGILGWRVSLWDLLWPTGLLVFGVFGLFPDFSFFRLGCVLFGSYFLVMNLDVRPSIFGMELLLPVFLLLFGLSLLADALRRPKKSSIAVGYIPGHRVQTGNHCSIADDRFDCAISFGEENHDINLPRLAGGSASVSFGQMTIDLTRCEKIAEGCPISANCAFGELQFFVPKWCRVDLVSSKAFAAIDVKGSPDPDASVSVSMDASVSFGEITIRYI